MTHPTSVPKVGSQAGAALLWRSSEDGWTHEPLYLPKPILLLRVTSRETRVETPEGEVVACDPDRYSRPFRWIEEILNWMADSAPGTERRPVLRPVAPLAVVCAQYEFGRTFLPYPKCFPHADHLSGDELLVAFHATGFAWIGDRWKLLGRPLRPGAAWNGWRIPEWATRWPAPSVLPRPEIRMERPNVPEEEPQPTLPRAHYLKAVERAQEHLAAGDAYQVNMTVRFDGRTAAFADEIFQAGLTEGGSQFAALVRGMDRSFISFSPELLLRRWGRRVSTRPIKGTRRRIGDELMDEAAASDLLASAKERAEHIMIVDLERNDLGRVCEYGSIRVEPLMELTQHPTLLHLESTVWGTLRGGVGLRDLFGAVFPGGSVTGAPKKSALEIIGSLETKPRGLYCGALGWIDQRGDMEFNLPIRTATLHDDGRLQLQAGGGIVADSVPEREWDELVDKLRFLMTAVRSAAPMPDANTAVS